MRGLGNCRGFKGTTAGAQPGTPGDTEPWTKRSLQLQSRDVAASTKFNPCKIFTGNKEKHTNQQKNEAS